MDQRSFLAALRIVVCMAGRSGRGGESIQEKRSLGPFCWSWKAWIWHDILDHDHSLMHDPDDGIEFYTTMMELTHVPILYLASWRMQNSLSHKANHDR